MSKSITVDESVYNQFKEWAEKDHRSISKELEFMVDSILNRRLVFVDSVTGQQSVVQSQPSQPTQPSEISQESMSKPVLNGGLLTPEEIKKYSGQNIIITDD